MSKKTKLKRLQKRQKQEAEFTNAVRRFFCPSCKKRRLKRPLDFDIKWAQEQEDLTLSDGSVVQTYRDVCDTCKVKFFREHFPEIVSDPDKVLQAMEEGQSVESLEDML